VSAPEPSGRRRWPGAHDSCRARTPHLTGECRPLQSEGGVPVVYTPWTSRVPARYLVPHAQAPPGRPFATAVSTTTPPAPPAPGRIARGPRRSAGPGASGRAVGLPGALWRWSVTYRYLTRAGPKPSTPSASISSSHYPGHPVSPATKARPVLGPPRPCQDVSRPGPEVPPRPA
jgi:hypothetical protein